ncbi:unnamed protein product [Jaminaea pallidilutea]
MLSLNVPECCSGGRSIDYNRTKMAEAKLTKKQKKAADFKAGKGGKKRDKAEGAGDVPDEDLIEDGGAGNGVDAADTSVTASKEKTTKKSKKGKAGKERQEARETAAGVDAVDTEAAATAATTSASSSKKRKRANGADEDVSKSKDASGEAPASSKSKGKKKADADSESLAPDEAAAANASRKLIVFVGNMSFKSTADEIQAHFASHCGEKPTVRLLTTKSDPNKLSKSKQKSIAKGKASDTTVQSRGCGFVEFQTAQGLQKALGLHHMLFGGRQINVELTAGGGGNSEARSAKIKEKNKTLNEERKKLHQKYVEPAMEKKAATKAEAPQPPKKKVKGGEVGEAQWGKRAGDAGGAGQDQPVSKRKMPRWMASGANAVRLAE